MDEGGFTIIETDGVWKGYMDNMGKVAIMTDSNSGITQREGKELGITVLPMPFMINEKSFFEDISLTQQEFYERLKDDADISTSQPSVGDVLDTWKRLLDTHDEVVHIPMSSGLSNSCGTAVMLSEGFDNRVQVVDNQRISVTQKQSVFDAILLKDAGRNAREIKAALEDIKLNASIYLMVDTLKYLKKGGRITAAAAAVGTILNLKPVLQIHGEKLDAFAKARNVKHAKRLMIDAIVHDLGGRFKEKAERKAMTVAMAYTYDRETAMEFREEVMEHIPGYDITLDPLSLSVACHIGPGSLAMACMERVV